MALEWKTEHELKAKLAETAYSAAAELAAYRNWPKKSMYNTRLLAEFLIEYAPEKNMMELPLGPQAYAALRKAVPWKPDDSADLRQLGQDMKELGYCISKPKSRKNIQEKGIVSALEAFAKNIQP